MRVYSHGILVLGLVAVAPALLWCACVTWRIYCCDAYRLSIPVEQLIIFATIIMAIGGAMGLAWLGRECVVIGPTALARSTLVRKRTVRVLTATPL